MIVVQPCYCSQIENWGFFINHCLLLSSLVTFPQIEMVIISHYYFLSRNVTFPSFVWPLVVQPWYFSIDLCFKIHNVIFLLLMSSSIYWFVETQYHRTVFYDANLLSCISSNVLQNVPNFHLDGTFHWDRNFWFSFVKATTGYLWLYIFSYYKSSWSELSSPSSSSSSSSELAMGSRYLQQLVQIHTSYKQTYDRAAQGDLQLEATEVQRKDYSTADWK